MAGFRYKKTRLPKDPETNKPEPLLTFKRGALVHFAVSQYEAYMTTKLEGEATHFLPFNRGTEDGGAGNDLPEDIDIYATAYLWNEVLAPANILQIIGRFIHLEIKTEEAWDGRKIKKEALIFPRYHQWDLVTRLIQVSREEGPGHKYLAQHSAGSGKSNSIAWTAHQLSSLYNDQGEKVFYSIIVVTDRTVLDDQLQDTIYQFEHADGVVGRINRDEGQGSKSEKLAHALEHSQPIVIVTIQTFPFVLEAIEDSVSLRERRYAIIADEAHSSQSGTTARKLKEVLTTEQKQPEGGKDGEDELASSEDMIAATVASRRASPNLSYYAFTATPKSKTLELFGRLPNPEEPPSKTNKPRAFHVYSMRQAIEEGYILDVLKNYTNYKVAYNLAQKVASTDTEVDSKKAKVKLNQWVRLHDYNIAQKVMVIVEHFRDTVMGLLNGHAKAMVVTGSRKEAVRYKLEFDKYVQKKEYSQLSAMVAFSGEVTFSLSDPNCEGLLGEKFTETGMNPDLKGRDMRKAFDSDEYHVMIVAQKFQTGFEKLSLYARHLAPLLREQMPDGDPVDLSSVELSHYRLSKIKQQDLLMVKEGAAGLYATEDLGTGKPRDKQEEWLSRIISRLNGLFVTDGLTDRDLINYACTICDKVRENERVMHQIANNSPEQALLGDFAGALDDAVMESGEAHQNQMTQYLNNKEMQTGFQRVVLHMLMENRE